MVGNAKTKAGATQLRARREYTHPRMLEFAPGNRPPVAELRRELRSGQSAELVQAIEPTVQCGVCSICFPLSVLTP